jgi:hypothetical protein
VVIIDQHTVSRRAGGRTAPPPRGAVRPVPPAPGLPVRRGGSGQTAIRSSCHRASCRASTVNAAAAIA